MENNLHIFKSKRLPAKAIGMLFLGLAFYSCKKNEPSSNQGIDKVNHVVVIYLENHSFDNLYGQFAGANGLSNATAANTTQVDATGTAYTVLPPVPGTPAFPTNLPNNYFNIDQYVPNDVITQDVLHRYYQGANADRWRKNGQIFPVQQ